MDPLAFLRKTIEQGDPDLLREIVRTFAETLMSADVRKPGDDYRRQGTQVLRVQRLDIRPIEPIKNGTDVIGRRVKVKVVKNKVAPPFKIAEMEILATEGISREGGLLDMGLATNVVSKYGAWFNYGEARLGQGRENSKQFLRDHPDVAAELEAKVREKSGSAAIAVAAPDGEEG